MTGARLLIRANLATRTSLAVVATVLAVMIAPVAAGAATSRPEKNKADPRIRYVVFNNDAVTTVPVSLGISTLIQFQNDEVIETISAGDTKAWSIVPKKGSSIMFVKPLEPDAMTNVNVVTTKRIYALALVTSGERRGTFQVRFRFPEDEALKRLAGSADASSNHPDLKGFDPATLNYNYIFRGSDALKPRVAFDNGVKTFLEFSGDVPSIFLVGANGAESTVNSHREGRFIVIDKVAAQFTLRSGDDSTCLYNGNAGTKIPDEVETIYGPKRAETPVVWNLFGKAQP